MEEDIRFLAMDGYVRRRSGRDGIWGCCYILILLVVGQILMGIGFDILVRGDLATVLIMHYLGRLTVGFPRLAFGTTN